jgi:hypothetical protein
VSSSLAPEFSNPEGTVTVYSLGICSCSVCSSIAEPEELTRVVNLINPTGLDHPWSISEQPFRTGEANPHQCEKEPNRKHYLFEC